MKKENFSQLIGSVRQIGEIKKGKKLSGMKVTYREKPASVKEVQNVRKVLHFNFRIKPSQEKHWKEMAKQLGIKDLSTFIRGAVESAIFTSLRAQDPQWQKFIEAVQPMAQKILGNGFYDGGAEDFEAGGMERKGTP